MKPIRVLHVVECMNRAGVETWLMNLLRRIPRNEIAMDFLVHRPAPAHFDDEIAALGARRIVCVRPQTPWTYIPRFRKLLAQSGPYDVVHSHVDHFSGAVLKLCWHLGVRKRVMQCHNDTRPWQSQSSWPRRRYIALMNSWIDRYATHCLAVSEGAAHAMLRTDWERDDRFRMVHYGIDLKPFEPRYEPKAVRSELGIPSGAFVFGHVGRMEHQKNHSLLVRIFAALRRQRPNAHLLLVGDGPLRSQIHEQVSALGLAGCVTFAGVRADVPRLALGAMDFFLFPSRFEGFPLAFLEAQAAGLRCAVSDIIPSGAVFIKTACQRVSPDEPVEAWVHAIEKTMEAPIDSAEACRRRMSASISLDANLRALRDVYE